MKVIDQYVWPKIPHREILAVFWYTTHEILLVYWVGHLSVPWLKSTKSFPGAGNNGDVCNTCNVCSDGVKTYNGTFIFAMKKVNRMGAAFHRSLGVRQFLDKSCSWYHRPVKGQFFWLDLQCRKQIKIWCEISCRISLLEKSWSFLEYLFEPKHASPVVSPVLKIHLDRLLCKAGTSSRFMRWIQGLHPGHILRVEQISAGPRSSPKTQSSSMAVKCSASIRIPIKYRGSLEVKHPKNYWFWFTIHSMQHLLSLYVIIVCLPIPVSTAKRWTCQRFELIFHNSMSTRCSPEVTQGMWRTCKSCCVQRLFKIRMLIRETDQGIFSPSLHTCWSTSDLWSCDPQ